MNLENVSETVSSLQHRPISSPFSIPVTQLMSHTQPEHLGKDPKVKSIHSPDSIGTGQNSIPGKTLPLSRTLASTNLFEVSELIIN
jgi:hypothetical protein